MVLAEESDAIVITDTRRGGLLLHEEDDCAREEVAIEDATWSGLGEDAELVWVEGWAKIGWSEVDDCGSTELDNSWLLDTAGTGGFSDDDDGTTVGPELRVTTCTLRLEPV